MLDHLKKQKEEHSEDVLINLVKKMQLQRNSGDEVSGINDNPTRTILQSAAKSMLPTHDP